LREDAHGGFGERSGETGREQFRHRAPGLLIHMLDQAASTRFVRKAVAVTTSEGVPTLYQMTRREALKKK
jgi:hypothetical protein